MITLYTVITNINTSLNAFPYIENICNSQINWMGPLVLVVTSYSSVSVLTSKVPVQTPRLGGRQTGHLLTFGHISRSWLF